MPTRAWSSTCRRQSRARRATRSWTASRPTSIATASACGPSRSPPSPPFAGFVGLSVPRFESHFTPCVEIGWRLAAPYWGRGYATEGARAALAVGFETLGLGEIVSSTVPANLRSRRVMEKIGMARDPDDDFDHPALPEGHRLRRHVLYRIAARTR